MRRYCSTQTNLATPINNAQQRGFTLLEVLVALAILAISSMAVVSQTGQSLRQLHQLELKTVAINLAENQLNTLQLSDNLPVTGRQSQTLHYAEQNWLVSTEVSATSEPWLRKIEVLVSLDSNAGELPLASLIGYKGQH